MPDPFKPDPIGDLSDQQEVIGYLVREHERISMILSQQSQAIGGAGKLEELHAEPKKKFDWMMVAADGADWDPGKGRGIYVWLNQAWNYVQIGEPVEEPAGTEPEPPEEPAPPPVGEYDLKFSFETDKTEGGAFKIQAASPDRASLVSFAREGSKSVQLTTSGNDTGISGSGSRERCDLRLNDADSDGFPGREHWWATSIRLGADFKADPRRWTSYVLWDFHATGGQLGGAPIQFDVSVDQTDKHFFRAIVQGGATGDAADERRFKLRGGEVPELNKWYDLVWHFIWARDNTGLTELWMRKEGEAIYKKEFTTVGPNMYFGYTNYLKLANYHERANGPSSVIHDRVIRGKTPYSVAMDELEGVPVP
jgi:hypothetical protein